ncbi:MAG: ribokinase [Candidatus Limnocylindrales bacterium]|jgi:ribokinase
MSAPRAEVIVIGSANVDLIVRASRLPAPGVTVTGGTFSRQPGGKGANQAVAAARYGASTRLVAAVGDDAMGDELVAGLKASGVGTGGVARLPRVASGVALIVVDAQGENQIAVASGANAELTASLVVEALEAFEATSATVCLIGFEIGNEAVMAGARWARKHGLALIVNPAPARPLPAGLTDLAPILTPNRGEAATLTGVADAAEAAGALAAVTGAPVVVTLGVDGALVHDADGVATVPAPSVTPVDATGAGDAFNGILAAELAAGQALHEAVAHAVVGASLATEHLGAQASLPTRDGVAAAMDVDR